MVDTEGVPLYTRAREYGERPGLACPPSECEKLRSEAKTAVLTVKKADRA